MAAFDSVETVRVMRAVIAPTAASTRRTAARPAIFSSASIGTEARIEPTRRDAYSTFAPASANCPSSFCETCARMSTSVVSAAVTFTPVRSCGAAVRIFPPARRRSSTDSRLSSLRSAGERSFLTACSAATCSAAFPLSPGSAAWAAAAPDVAMPTMALAAASRRTRRACTCASRSTSRAARPGERTGASGAGNYPCVRPR